VGSRDELLAAAQRRLNADPTASMADLAEAAGVGRATLHRHFSSREDLLREIGTRSLDRWQDSQDAAGLPAAAVSGDRDEVEAALREMLTRFVADSDDFGFALTDGFMLSDPALRARSEELFAREVTLYAAAQATGLLRPDVPARWVGHTVYGLLVAARDALDAGDVARRGLADLVLDTLFTGLTGASAPVPALSPTAAGARP